MNKIEEKAEKYSKLVSLNVGNPSIQGFSGAGYKIGYKEALEDLEIWMKLNQDDIDRKGCTMIEQYLKQFE